VAILVDIVDTVKGKTVALSQAAAALGEGSLKMNLFVVLSKGTICSSSAPSKEKEGRGSSSCGASSCVGLQAAALLTLEANLEEEV